MIGLEKPHLTIAESYNFRKVLSTKKNAWFHLKCLFAIYIYPANLALVLLNKINVVRDFIKALNATCCQN